MTLSCSHDQELLLCMRKQAGIERIWALELLSFRPCGGHV
jgi:hypothetical protein